MSKALKINLEKSRVDVTIDPKYYVIQDVMSRYFGLQDGLSVFLKEVCHPYRNWKFIVNESRKLSLSYFYDLKTHPKGSDAAQLYIEIYLEAVEKAKEPDIKSDAFKNLYLLLQKIVKESGDDFEKFLPVLNYAFIGIKKLPQALFSFVCQNYYQLNKLAGNFFSLSPKDTDYDVINSLLIRYFETTYSYWLSESDPLAWFEGEIGHNIPGEVADLFVPILHRQINDSRKRLNDVVLKTETKNIQTLEKLLELPGYGEIVGDYESIPQKLMEVAGDEKMKNLFRLFFLFRVMNISGLSFIHEEALREINRTITWIIGNEDHQNIERLIQKTFNILNKSFQVFPESVLMCLLNMAKGIYKTDESDLVNFFNQSVVQLGFQMPDFRGIGDDWQIRSNIAHVQNIRTWMKIIELKPKWSKKLMSSLIVNISLYGVLVKDTDLFPRDITEFLNSDIQPVYNLAKQLMRLFPAYFHEIGAEGRLRDISTRIDEIIKRRDILIHFLRKQSHVESSNKIISLIESILDFWKTKAKDSLKSYLPENIYEQIDENGPYVDGVHKILNGVFDETGFSDISDLLTLQENYFEKFRDVESNLEAGDVERVALAVSFYKLLNQKYCFRFCDINESITQAQSGALPYREELIAALNETDTFRKVSNLLEYLEELKALILSRESFEIREDIYRKRHIAAGIPSMYGSYHEAKFDALGLTFRLEPLVNTLFEELINDIDLEFITHATFIRIFEYLKLFEQALAIDGVYTREYGRQLDLLEKALNIKLITFTQYIDIFRGFSQVVGNIVMDYFNNIHKQNLLEITQNVNEETLLPKFVHGSPMKDELFQKVSEIFLRDSIATSCGLQILDIFLARILNTLYDQAEKLPVDKHYLLLTYNPRNVVTSLTHINSKVSDMIHLGNKALNIIKIEQMGLPVPPGFVITTEVYRSRELIDSYPPANRHFREQVDMEIAQLERLSGRYFGNPENPLLVSVRSGGVVSLPGMMDSYLDVGMNPDIVDGIIKQSGNEWFACDCYRRFLQSYGMSFGLRRDDFDSIIQNFKKKYSVSLKKDFSPQQMKEVAMEYKKFIRSNGIEIEESPREQLYIAINRVLNSWNSEKALTYRKIIGISDDWGTSVTVQAMVFGNISQNSGSGVLFTHSPKFSVDMLRPWGDYTIGNQGEDVVSGLVATYPISIYQANMESRPVDYALERRFPHIYKELRKLAKLLIYDKLWGPQDIEFTFESPDEKDLYILQTRHMEMREIKRLPSFESTSEMSKKFLGHGIGVSGGAMTGRVVFTLDDISEWRRIEPDTSLILVRGDTVPDDIKEISLADGLLTARGGATSHAAIVANRLDKTCVVGCLDLVCMERDKKFILKEKVLGVGDFISIDGAEGSIYSDRMKLK
jgi:pyruvate,orthophosphate dikinase